EPQGAHRARQVHALVPYRDLLDLNLGLHDRHHRGAIFLDGDRIFQLVLEQVAELARGSRGRRRKPSSTTYAGINPARNSADHCGPTTNPSAAPQSRSAAET